MANLAGINSGGINASSTTRAAEVVDIPLAEAGIRFIAFDREGNEFLNNVLVGIEFDTSADLVSVKPIPKAEATATAVVVGSLSNFSAKNLGTAEAESVFVTVANLIRINNQNLTNVVTGGSSDATAYLSAIRYIAGSTEIAFETYGNLIVDALMSGRATVRLDEDGRLTKIHRLSGSTGVEITHRSALSVVKRLNASERVAFGVAGSLALLRKRNVGDVSAELLFDVDGRLRQEHYLEGSIEMLLDATAPAPKDAAVRFDPVQEGVLFDVFGRVGAIMFLEGMSDVILDADGNLQNNAFEPDLPNTTMYRVAVDTLMVKV